MHLPRRSIRYYLRYSDRYLKRLITPLFPAAKPDFVIIGAQKAATTSLFNYLNQVPGIIGSTNKEIYYFDREINYGKNLKWYHNHFRNTGFWRDSLFFEATPNYLYFPWVAEKLHAYNPKLKLVVILRDPVARAYSAWNMYKDFFDRNEQYRLKKGLRPGELNYIYEHLFRGRESFPSFEECVQIEQSLINVKSRELEPSLLRRGLYHQQLGRYYECFKPDQIFCIGYADLMMDPVGVMGSLYTWLTGGSVLHTSLDVEKRNARRYDKSMNPATREYLTEFYAGEKKVTEELIQHTINW